MRGGVFREESLESINVTLLKNNPRMSRSNVIQQPRFDLGYGATSLRLLSPSCFVKRLLVGRLQLLVPKNVGLRTKRDRKMNKAEKKF